MTILIVSFQTIQSFVTGFGPFCDGSSGIRGAPRGEHFSTHCVLLASGPRASWAQPLPATPFSVSTITDGYARIRSAAPFSPLRWPDCTLSRLRAEEYDRPVTQSIATPEPSSRTITTLDRTLGVGCRPSHLNFDRFHQPCLVVSVPRGGHLPFLGSPVLPLLRLTGGCYHAD